MADTRTVSLTPTSTALKAKQTEFMVALQRREGITVERSSDESDNLRLAAQRDLAIGYLQRGVDVLRAVRTALLPIRDGSYGHCLHCEKPISARPLTVAAYCERCQEAVDQGDVEDESLDKLSHWLDAA